MRKVKFIYNNGELKDLTYAKVYDVLETNIINSIYSIPIKTITIINDSGENITTYTSLLGQIYFIDVTAEYRNEIINGILL